MSEREKEMRLRLAEIAKEIQEMAYGDIPVSIIFERLDWMINEFNKKYNM